MKLEVKCSVNNCHYWRQGNECYANQILITSDAESARQPDSFDAPKINESLQTPVNNCMETSCKTFVHRNSAKINEDMVVKK